MDPSPPFYTTKSTDSLEESLLPSHDTEADIIFTPKMPVAAADVTPVRLGGADLGAPGHPVAATEEEEGMLMGPSHPIFSPDPNRPSPSADLPVPPGARFDPISPVGPGFYSPGEPDFDDLIPPGGGQNPLGPSVRPPRKSGSKTFSMPGFGHPHGAPPGPGNPPFFM